MTTEDNINIEKTYSSSDFGFEKMKKAKEILKLEVTNTNKKCSVGEKVGSKNLENNKIPVISCEGACIRGEIARLAANLVAKEEPFRRACHGELFAVPDSSMSEWIKKSEKTVLIDGCFLRCHGRIIENLIGEENLIQFDALSYYKKYTDSFDIDSVPEEERKKTAQFVAERILETLGDEIHVTRNN